MHTDRKSQSTQQRLVLDNFRCDALKTRKGIQLFSLPFGTQVKSWDCVPQGSQAKEEEQTLMLTTTYGHTLGAMDTHYYTQSEQLRDSSLPSYPAQNLDHVHMTDRNRWHSQNPVPAAFRVWNL